MKFVVLCIVVLFSCLFCRQVEEERGKENIRTTEQSEELVSSSGMRERMIHRYALLKEAFTSAIQLDNSGVDKIYFLNGYMVLLSGAEDSRATGFYSASVKYAGVMSLRYKAGFYLYFLKKLLI